MDSTALLARPPAAAAEQVGAAFCKRGLQVVERRSGGGGLVLRFKGEHRQVVTGARPMRSRDLGSVYFARLLPTASGTELILFGRPTLDGRELCADTEPSWAGDCESAGTAVPLSDEREVDTLRSVLLELRPL
jgi:hypothetical protein